MEIATAYFKPRNAYIFFARSKINYYICSAVFGL